MSKRNRLSEEGLPSERPKKRRSRIIPLAFGSAPPTVDESDLRLFVEKAREWIKMQQLHKRTEIKISKKKFVTLTITAVDSINLASMVSLRDCFGEMNNLFDICFLLDTSSVEMSFKQREDPAGVLQLELVDETKWELTPVQESTFADRLKDLRTTITKITSMVFMKGCTWVVSANKVDNADVFHLTMRFPTRKVDEPIRKISISLLSDFQRRAVAAHPGVSVMIDRTNPFGQVHVMFKTE